VSDLVHPGHLRVMEQMLAREMPNRIPTKYDVHDISVAALLIARELGVYPQPLKSSPLRNDAAWLTSKAQEPMKEAQARRQLELAREAVEHSLGVRRALVSMSALSLVVVATGIVLTAVVSWPYVFVSIVAFIVAAICTPFAFMVNSEDVRPDRKALRKAEWDYEDAILQGPS
jgi:hypothetical protein